MTDPKPQTPGSGSQWKYWGPGKEHTVHLQGPLASIHQSRRDSSTGPVWPGVLTSHRKLGARVYINPPKHELSLSSLLCDTGTNTPQCPARPTAGSSHLPLSAEGLGCTGTAPVRGSTRFQDYPVPPSPGCLSWRSSRVDDARNLPRASVIYGLTLCLLPSLTG